MTPEREAANQAQQEEASGTLVVCGINYNTATLAEREPFQVSRKHLIPALKELRKLRSVQEGVILSTCNRFEAYLVLQEGEQAFPVMREFFIRFCGIDPMPLRRNFYIRHGSTVARHLFRVTAGMDSLVFGEYQIQNQIKEAYSDACSVKAPGKTLHRLFHAGFRAGKAIRTQTAVGAGRMSVGGMAVGVIKEELEADSPILFVGVNENIRIVVEGLKAAGFSDFTFANRTRYKADKLATRYGGKGFGLEELPALLAAACGVVSCTGASSLVITADMLEGLAKAKHNLSLLVDMAVPRDIERPRDDAPSFRIIDLEDLKALRNGHIQIRKDELPAAERIVEDSVCTFQSWMDGAFHAGVGALVKEFDRVRQIRLEEALASFRPEDREALEHFSRMLMQDLLKLPMASFLKAKDIPSKHKS